MEKIKIVKNNICADIERLKSFIIDEWQSGELYQFHYNHGLRGQSLYVSIFAEIDNFLDDLRDEIKNNARKRFNNMYANLDWQDIYPKDDVRSIGFELLWMVPNSIEMLTTDDIPMILEFLETPPDKALEAWAKWEHYWDNLDYPARRKKLLESVE